MHGEGWWRRSETSLVERDEGSCKNGEEESKNGDTLSEPHATKMNNDDDDDDNGRHSSRRKGQPSSSSKK